MAPPPLVHTLSLSAKDREERLLKWITEKCTDNRQIINFAEGWEMIWNYGIRVVFEIVEGNCSDRKPFGTKGHSSLYTISYRMCSNPNNRDDSDKIYEKFHETFEKFSQEIAAPRIAQKHGVFQLQEFLKQWENFKLLTKWMHKLFCHLDNSYVTTNNLATLVSCAFQIFYKSVFNSHETSLRNYVLEEISKERHGEVVDRDIIKAIVEVFTIMGLNTTLDIQKVEELKTLQPPAKFYQEQFEYYYLEQSTAYFQLMSRNLLDYSSTPEYMKIIEHTLGEEEIRARSYLQFDTFKKLTKKMDETLLQSNAELLLRREKNGFFDLLVQDQIQDVTLIFNLYSRIPDLELLAQIFQEFVKHKGSLLLEQRKALLIKAQTDKTKELVDDSEFIIAILELHEKIAKLVETVFLNNIIFQKAFKDGFKYFFNKNIGKQSNAELLAAYSDKILKGTIKMTDVELEEQIERTICLFSFVMDKDLFAEIYRDLLAKRLLNDRSISNDAEKSFITKLKRDCGAPFTAKMEGMLADLALGSDIKKEFMDHYEKHKPRFNIPQSLDFSVQILTMGFWPSPLQIEATIVPEMEQCIAIFSEYYHKRHNGKNLKWLISQGEIILKGTFAKRTHDIIVTTLQALVLFLFDGTLKELSFEEINGSLHLNNEISKRVLHSLTCGKFKILNKNPPTKTVNINDKFSSNTSFLCQMKKFRVPMASLEDVNYQNNINEDRGFAIDAAIVRVMKARKRLAHNDLLAEVTRQLHYFQPQPKVIKQRIESLIEREYLERDETDPARKTYNYLP